MTKTNLEYALEYLKLGLVPLPCMGEGDSKGKIPLIKWKEIQEVPSEAQVTQWFNRFPDANIGFKTGKVSGVLVLDNDGVEIHDPLPLTPIATSRPGHFHYYLEYPGFYVPPSASKVGQNLDIRCDQAFIVGAPSKHFDKKTGEVDGEYTWVEGFSPFDIPFAPCPEWLITKLKATLENKIGYDWSTAINTGTGARDDTLTRAAASLISKGFDKETALAILIGLNNTFTPPLTAPEIERKLESAINKFKSETHHETEDIFGIDNLSNIYIDGSENGKVESRLKYLSDIVNITEISEEAEVIDWLWEGYLARGHLTMLSALWKAGKSTLIGAFLKLMEESDSLANRKTTACKVLVISEESINEWAIRRKKLDLGDNVNIWSKPLFSKLDQPSWISFIKDIYDSCVWRGIDLVIFDTISKFWSVNQENEAAQMEAALLPLNLLLRNNLAVLIIHHFRKSGGEDGVASRGSGVLGSTVDIILEYTRTQGSPNSTARDLSLLSRFEEPSKITLTFNMDTGLPTDAKPSSQFKEEAKMDNLLTQISLLVENEFPEGVTIKELRENWNEEFGRKPGNSSLTDKFKKLVLEEKLKVVSTRDIKGSVARVYKPFQK